MSRRWRVLRPKHHGNATRAWKARVCQLPPCTFPSHGSQGRRGYPLPLSPFEFYHLVMPKPHDYTQQSVQQTSRRRECHAKLSRNLSPAWRRSLVKPPGLSSGGKSCPLHNQRRDFVLSELDPGHIFFILSSNIFFILFSHIYSSPTLFFCQLESFP